MVFADINYVAVVVAAVAYFALGALWYSPALFGNTWREALGKTKEDLEKGAGLSYAVAALATLGAAFVLAYLVTLGGLLELGVARAAAGAMMGVLAWAGLVLTTLGINDMFSGRPRQVFLIDSGYHLVGFFVMGGIIGSWG